MEKFEVKVGHGSQEKTFEVKDYPHHPSGRCKFEVFKDDAFVLGLEPDGNYLHTCKNPGVLDEELIHLIIDKIEITHF